MSKKLLLVLALFCSITVYSNEMEDGYAAVKQQYEQRQKGADKALQEYLKRYPYTTYSDEVKMMLGVVQVEGKKYKQALKNFEEVKLTRLGRDQQPEYQFYRGYAYLMMGEYQKSLTFFSALRQKETPYTLAARYYYAFAYYKLGNYDKALPEFLAIEQTAQYSDIVPYYIIQIYYSQGNLTEVEQRAAYVMEANPGNPNNGEVERILGELQYQRGAYAQAIPHLEAYEKSFRAQKKELAKKKTELDAQQKEAETLMKQIKADEAAYKKKQAEIDLEMSKARAALDALINQNTANSQNTEYYGGSFGWPTPGYKRITSPYGPRTFTLNGKRVSSYHRGIDIGAPSGAKIAASNGGKVVTSAYNAGGYGNYVILDHGGGKMTVYGHMSKRMVSVGQSVTKGQQIGKVGSTGRSTGPHLHFEIRINGTAVNPINYL